MGKTASHEIAETRWFRDFQDRSLPIAGERLYITVRLTVVVGGHAKINVLILPLTIEWE